MAVVLVHQGAGLTKENYEESVRRVTGGKSTLESPADWPVEGLLAHAAGEAPGGFRVVDVWESEEAARRFGERSFRFYARWASRPNRRCTRLTRSFRPSRLHSWFGHEVATSAVRPPRAGFGAAGIRPRDPRFRGELQHRALEPEQLLLPLEPAAVADEAA